MTTYSDVARNSTDYTDAPAVGRLSYLLTDTPDFILVGTDEDETLILWDTTEFSDVARNTTTYSDVVRNTTAYSDLSRNTTAYSDVTRN
jgi:hypothetical protein